MNKIILLVLLTIFGSIAFAEKYNFEEIQLVGVENPISIALSANGLQMVIIDQPKKGLLSMKICNRPYLESKWSAAMPIETVNKLIDKNTRIAGPSYTYDHRYLYFSANFSNSKGGMDIYYCEILKDGWSNPVNIGNPINTVADENYPSISGNNRTLFFTREVKMKKLENFNTGELFTSKIDKQTEKWGDPEKINTAINDGGIAYPKIYDDNNTILYSRITDDKEGWKIFKVKKLNNLQWYLPAKLDTLSSKDNEISPAYCKQDQNLYFIKYEISSFSAEGKIYRYKLDKSWIPEKTITIKGRIKDAKTKKPVSANVLVTNPVMNTIQYKTISLEEDGKFEILLNAEQTYMFHVWKDNYSHVYELFSSEKCKSDFSIDFEIFPEAKVKLNMYDSEELWPLNGEIIVKNKAGEKIDAKEQKVIDGQKILLLPVGQDYTLLVSNKDYQNNEIELALSNIILFDELVRDIKLDPEKRAIEIFITDKETNNPLEATIELYDERERLFIPEKANDKPGEYKISLREGEKFNVEIRGPRGFAFNHVNIDLNAQRDLTRLNVALQPLMRKVPIRLNNINFESNSADLQESSFVELNRVVQLLIENPDIHTEIMAHTDDIGSDKYNSVLADKRAMSVVEYLIIGGISSNRLVAKGYGETMPVVPNDSEANRALNRRVEMKILDENDSDFFIEERIIQK